MTIFLLCDKGQNTATPMRGKQPSSRRVRAWRSISGVPSTQSSPRTSMTFSLIATTSTTDEAIGLGRTGERSAKVPITSPDRDSSAWRGACSTRSRQRCLVHPVKHPDAGVPGKTGERGAPLFVDDDGTDRPVGAAALGAILPRAPGRSDAADEINAGIHRRRQGHRDFAGPEIAVVLVRHRATIAAPSPFCTASCTFVIFS